MTTAPRRLLATLLIVAAGGLLAVNHGCDQGTKPTPVGLPPVEPTPVAEERTFSPEFVQKVDTFCGACHPPTPFEDYPKSDWKKEVEQGFGFYFASDLKLEIPIQADVVAYFKSQAPERLEPPDVSLGLDMGKLKLRREDGPSPPQRASVAHMNWMQLDPDQPPQLIVADMGHGTLAATSLTSGAIELTTIAQLNHPCHTEPCDLDGDGVLEIVAADLGSFLPGDHNNGRVVWLRPSDEGYETIVLADELGRVADVEPGDFDGDGDQDLVVAVFGWRATGEILLLENQGGTDGDVSFKSHQLDDRHGAIHVPVIDINGDGRLDFLAVFGQEHESVELYVNKGGLSFDRTQLFSAGRPNYGCSGIKLTDLDQDGDTDVLFTNGDMLDNPFVRQFHRVQWLENRDGDWEHHEIAVLPGVHRALPSDLDGDGDLDIVACALLHPETLEYYPGYEFDSVIWLEQTEPGTWVRHAIEMGAGRHANLELGDFDGDGDDDFVVGNHEFGDSDSPVFTIWWNDGINE